MIAFFPEPYPDELAYSLFARYHVHSGNITFSATAKDLFQCKDAIPNPEFFAPLSEEVCSILTRSSTIYPFDDPVAIICNEEGKIDRLPLNRALYTEDGEMFDITAGNIMIVGLGEEDFASLQGELLEKYLEKFKHPESFIKIGDDILAIKLPEEQKQTEGQTQSHRHR